MNVTHKNCEPLPNLQAAREAIAPLYDEVDHKHQHVMFWENSTKTKGVREILVSVEVGTPLFRKYFYNAVKKLFAATLPPMSCTVYRHGAQHRAKVFYSTK